MGDEAQWGMTGTPAVAPLPWHPCRGQENPQNTQADQLTHPIIDLKSMIGRLISSDNHRSSTIGR